MKINFEDMRSPEVGELVEKNGMVVVPIGACEEHGNHIPVSTDTLIAYEAALGAAKKISDKIPIAVLPAVWFGYTVGVLKNWPGTITIRPKVLIDLMYDICSSLIDMGIDKILIVNAHGNNPGVLDVAVRSIGDDYKVFPGVVNTYNCWTDDIITKNRRSKYGGISHGGEFETSLMLYLTDLTDMSVADDTDISKSNLKYCPMEQGKKKRFYVSTWFLENPKHGAMGDPTCATEGLGKIIHDTSVDLLVEIIKEFYDIQVKLKGRKLNRKCTRF